MPLRALDEGPKKDVTTQPLIVLFIRARLRIEGAMVWPRAKAL
jgi:hypothetical protein